MKGEEYVLGIRCSSESEKRVPLFLEQFLKNLSIVWVVRQFMIHDSWLRGFLRIERNNQIEFMDLT